MYLIFLEQYFLGLEIHISLGALQCSDKHQEFLMTVLRRMALPLRKIRKSEKESLGKWKRSWKIKGRSSGMYKVNIIGTCHCCVWAELPWKLSPNYLDTFILQVSR
jgi:hypothetical protein